MKKTLICATALTAISTALSAPAIAQDDEDSARRLGTVNVTAQRVEENLQDVPVAVTALSTEQIEDKQVLNIRDLTAQVPNINIATNTGTASAARIFLRGVGEDESRGAVDQAVGIYVDGVYIGRSVGSLFDVVDLESIEVLRGPQGTLYGRNTVGGAIKLTPVKPQMENSAKLSAVLGNYDRVELKGTGNFQIADSTAVRVTGFSRQRDGFHDVIPNGPFAGEGPEGVGALDTFAIRASLLHEFNDDWSLLVAVDHTDDNSDPIPDSAAPGNDADNDIFTIEPLPGTTCPAGGLLPLGCFTAYNSEVQSTGVMARFDGAFGTLDFTSISAYRELEDDLSTRIGFPFTQMTDQNQFSQEFTIGQTGQGALDWIAGLYYFEEDLVLDSVFIFPFSIDTSTESIALFGQGTYMINDQLSVTGGLRYTEDSKDFDGVGPFGFARTDSATFDNLSFTIGVDYRFNDDILGYAKFATGFKSGGWSPDAFSGTAVFLPVDEETLDSFEVGLKSDFNDSFRLNVAAFFNQYEGLQIGATVPGLGFTRFNVDETEIAGLEVEAVWQVTDNFQVNGNLGLLDAEYTSLTGDQARGLSNNGAGCPAGVDPTNDAQIINCALGLDLKNAPEYKATIGVLYTEPVYQGELIVSADASFEDDSWSLVANSPAHAFIEIDTLVNARVKYADDRGWSVAVFGRNLTDEEYYRASSASSFTTYASPPLEYGIELGVEF
eukprot:g3399.t1